MKLIVDASIAVKWLIAEPYSNEARRLLAPRIFLYAPDFILTEVANVIWKKARRKDIPSPQRYIEELANISDAVGLQPSTELVIWRKPRQRSSTGPTRQRPWPCKSTIPSTTASI